MSVVTIDLGEPDNPPNYNSLFDFIESEEGQEFLLRAERGHFSFTSAMSTLKDVDALPVNSSKRVWHCIRMMYTKTLPHSILHYD